MKQKGFTGGLVVLIGVTILLGAALLANFRNLHLPIQNQLNSNQPEQSQVSWQLGKGNVWQAIGTPPSCPDPLVLASPVNISKVSAILYPGQPRGGAFKPHGAFRFNNQGWR